MPTTIIACPHCAFTLQGDDNLLGQFVQCPKCGQNFVARRPRHSAKGGKYLGAMLLAALALLFLVGGAFGVYFLKDGFLPQAPAQAKTEGDGNKSGPAGSEAPLPSPGNPPLADPSKGNAALPGAKVEPTGSGEPATVTPTTGAEPKKSDPPLPEPKKPDPVPAPEPKKFDPPPPDLPPLGKKDPVVPPLPKNADGNRVKLSKENQDKVNAAIDKGVQFIKSTQRPDGSWDSSNGEKSLGYCSLAALTLLECGVSPNDPAVQKTAALVRAKAPAWVGFYCNYDVATCVLFLDKLGDKKDSELIRFLALRLIAGQKSDGGWHYDCPQLSNQEAFALLAYLQAIRPVPSLVAPDGGVTPLPTDGKEPPAGEKPAAPANSLVEPIFKPFNVGQLPPSLQNLAVVQTMPALKAKGRKEQLKNAGAETDNSNTQFSIMAVWVARKYNIPVDKTMALVDQRFLSSQSADGGWDYRYSSKTATPAMTCVGLIGLAAGHGAHKESLGTAWKMAGGKSGQEDAGIQAGLAYIAKDIGTAPVNWNEGATQGNLYFIWSVERVAVLYNLKTIGGKEWYSWAAHMLVVNQGANGSWGGGGYIGATPTVSTCLALLTLKRANFVPDLTEVLEDFVPIRDPGQK